MSQPILSILIPITPDRREGVLKLYKNITRQTGINTLFLIESSKEIRHGNNSDYSIELIEYMDNREMSIGEKREYLYKIAKGKYSWQIDSDDDISDDAIKKVLIACESSLNVDCITFQESVTINGQYSKSNFSLEYEDWAGDGNSDLGDGFSYHRTPFYKCVIKTDIARSVPFEYIRYGEDHVWARALRPHLKTEIHIPEEVYIYTHNSKPEDHNERYGIN